MSERRNLMIVHSWEEQELYDRALSLLKSTDSGIADYSVPAWNPIPGPVRDVEASLRSRISTATAVVVLNTDGLHRRGGSSFEMRTATEMGKRIIVLQPPGNFRQPIPKILDGSVYYVAPWRSDVLGRAIRGEYPQDGRLFDVAEQVEREQLIQCLSLGVGAVSLAVLVRTLASHQQLLTELAVVGIQLEHTDEVKRDLAKGFIGGAIAGGALTALLTRDVSSAIIGAVGGGFAGMAVSAVRTHQAMLHGSSEIRVLALAEAEPQ